MHERYMIHDVVLFGLYIGESKYVTASFCIVLTLLLLLFIIVNRDIGNLFSTWRKKSDDFSSRLCCYRCYSLNSILWRAYHNIVIIPSLSLCACISHTHTHYTFRTVLYRIIIATVIIIKLYRNKRKSVFPFYLLVIVRLYLRYYY